MGCVPSEPDDEIEPDERGAVGVFPVEDGIVVVAARARLTPERACALRHATFAQLARNPRMLIVEITPPAVTAGRDCTMLDATTVTVLTEIAYEAGAADIGLCLVVPPDRIAPVIRALDGAGVRELFEIRPTIADALGSPP
jgi:hypothetical protein